jgi:hypothetical protein
MRSLLNNMKQNELTRLQMENLQINELHKAWCTHMDRLYLVELKTSVLLKSLSHSQLWQRVDRRPGLPKGYVCITLSLRLPLREIPKISHPILMGAATTQWHDSTLPMDPKIVESVSPPHTIQLTAHVKDVP